MDRLGLQQRLGSTAQVARRQINLPIKENVVGWREALTKVLEEMGGS